jgi:hypothetical protein
MPNHVGSKHYSNEVQAQLVVEYSLSVNSTVMHPEPPKSYIKWLSKNMLGARIMVSQSTQTKILKRGQKICPNLLIKKKRIVQLINRKPGENSYNKTTRETTPKTCNSKPTSSDNLQLRTHDTWSTTMQRSTNRTTIEGYNTQVALKVFLATPLFLLLPLIITFL